MTLSEFFESIQPGDIDQDFSTAPNAAGLYVIVNTVTWKAYIGQSQRIASRFLSHRYELRRNNHSNHRLQEDWNMYGEAIFRFCVFEIMDANLLFEAESQLIFSSVGSCYNYFTDLPNKPRRVKLCVDTENRKPTMIRIPSRLLTRITEGAKRLGISRSAFIVQSAAEKLESMTQP